MQKIVLGTGNKHKMAEIGAIVEGLPFYFDIAGNYGPFDPDESGTTLEENAIIKARATMQLVGEKDGAFPWTFADDSGLFVDALDGRPGIYAARYAGANANYRDNITKLLNELDGVPPEKRGATLACVIAFCRPGEHPETFRGEYRGSIALAPRNGNMFGYDPVFLVHDRDKTLSEIDRAEKNLFSHRGIAVSKFKDRLSKFG